MITVNNQAKNKLLEMGLTPIEGDFLIQTPWDIVSGWLYPPRVRIAPVMLNDNNNVVKYVVIDETGWNGFHQTDDEIDSMWTSEEQATVRGKYLLQCQLPGGCWLE